MFCRKCGAEIKNGDFCPKCGTKITDKIKKAYEAQMGSQTPDANMGPVKVASVEPRVSQTPVSPQPVSVNAQPANDSTSMQNVQAKVQDGIKATSDKIKNVAGSIASKVGAENKTDGSTTEGGKNNKTIIIVAVSVVALLIVLLLVKGSKKTIDLNDYVKSNFDGYNNYGVAEIYFDSNAFTKEYGDKMEYDGKKNGVYVLSDLVDYSVSQTEELKNGDIVTFAWNMPEDFAKKFNYKFKYSDIEYTVEGLSDMEHFDPFEGVNVVYTGTAPDGRAEIEVNNSYSSDLYYSLDKNSGLANGDSVVVTVSCHYETEPEGFIRYLNKVPDSVSKQYTVDGLGEFITSVDQISDETLQSMQVQALDIIKAYTADSNTKEEIFDSAEYVGGYGLFAKSNDIWGDKNNITLVYKVINRIEIPDENYTGSLKFYYYVQFKNVEVTPSGENVVDLLSYNTPGDSVSYKVKYGKGSWDYKSFYYKGYETLSEVENAVVTKNLSEYTSQVLGEGFVEEPEEEEEISVDYVLPNSDSEYISESDLEGLSEWVSS